MTALLEAPVRHWACPSCQTVDRTQRADAHTQMHNCPGMGGLTLPLVEVRNADARPDARHVLLEREDYVGDSGAGRYMSARTDHGDGSNDITVYAQPATNTVDGRATYQSSCAIAHSASTVADARFRHKFHDPDLDRTARLARKLGAQMAWSASGVFAYWNYLMGTKAVSLTTDTLKVALYGNSGTPDKTVTTAALTQYNGASSQWVTGNEVSGTGYTAGGNTLSGVTFTQSTNVMTLTATSPQWTSATITAYGDLVYDSTVSSDGVAFNYFGGVQTVTAGTFTVSYPSGIATWTS